MLKDNLHYFFFNENLCIQIYYKKVWLFFYWKPMYTDFITKKCDCFFTEDLCIQILLQKKVWCFFTENLCIQILLQKPEALKSLYRSPGYKKNQLVLCKNYVLQW